MAENRIGLDPRMFNNLGTGLAQGVGYLLVNPVSFDGAGAVYQQHPGAKGYSFIANGRDGTLAEQDLGRIMENEVLHAV